jgi:hypothetical protein
VKFVEDPVADTTVSLWHWHELGRAAPPGRDDARFASTPRPPNHPFAPPEASKNARRANAAGQHPNRLSDDLRLGDPALRSNPLYCRLQVLRQIQRRLLHACMAPPVTPPVAVAVACGHKALD